MPLTRWPEGERTALLERMMARRGWPLSPG